jgi:hypothetical protein
MLEPFIRMRFLEFHGGKAALFLCELHSESLICSLWEYYLAFGIRHEYWLLHAGYIAVQNLLFHQPLPGHHEQALYKGSKLLFLMGDYMPRSNNLVLSLWDSAQTKGIIIPRSCRTFLRAGSMRARRDVVGPVACFRPGERGTKLVTRGHHITFSSRIESIDMAM